MKYRFIVEGRMSRGSLISGYSESFPATRTYVAENIEQARMLAQMYNISPRKIVRIRVTKECLDERVKNVNRIIDLSHTRD